MNRRTRLAAAVTGVAVLAGAGPDLRPGRAVRLHLGPLGRARLEDQPGQAPQRDPDHRRRHRRLHDHRGPQLRARRVGPLRARRAALHRRDDHLRSQGRAQPQRLPDRLRVRLRTDGERLVHRQEDGRQPPLAGSQLGREHPGHRLRDGAGDLQEAGQAHRQRVHRRDHRRHPGRRCFPHQPARLPGPDRHGDLPAGQEVGRRQGLHRRAARRQQDRRHPGRRAQPLQPGHRRRADRPCVRREHPQLQVRRRQDGAGGCDLLGQRPDPRSLQRREHGDDVPAARRRDRAGDRRRAHDQVPARRTAAPSRRSRR